MKLIGLYSPFPQSGKSTLARALTRAVPGSKIIKFADAMVDLVVPLVAPFLDGGEEEVREWLGDVRKDTALIPELGVTLRHCLQTVGTGWGREMIHPDLWVMLVRKRLYHADNLPLVVVDDLRLGNEYAMLKKRDAFLVRVERPLGPETVPHSSNAQLEGLPFAFTAYNDGSIESLRGYAPPILCHLGLAT